MDTLNICLAGAGAFGVKHLEALARIDGVRVTSLVGRLRAPTAEAAQKFFDGLQRIWRATDLGRIKSVATIPAISTHQQQGDEGRRLAHIPPNLVRLCVGGEHPDDVIADLDRALAGVRKR